MPRLTKAELQAVIDAAGNVDTVMFEEEGYHGGKAAEAKAQRRRSDFERGLEKLRAMLAARETKSVQ